MKILAHISVIILVAVLVLGAGCMSTPGEETPTPTATVATTAPTVEPTAADGFSLQPEPTSVIPTIKYVAVETDKDAITGVITVSFRGGKGQDLVDSMQVTGYMATGQIIKKEMKPDINYEVVFEEGTKETDRVVVTAKFVDGTEYTVYDKAIPYR